MAGETIVSPSVAASQEFMRSIVDMDGLIYQLELDLKRKRMAGTDEKGQPLYEFYGPPRISDEGLQDVIAEIRSVLNPNTPFSYTQQADFNNFMLESCKVFAVRLWKKRKEWGIEPSDYLVICSMVRGIKEMCLRKTIGNNFKDFAASSRSTQEIISKEEQQKSGWSLPFFGKPKPPGY